MDVEIQVKMKKNNQALLGNQEQKTNAVLSFFIDRPSCNLTADNCAGRNAKAEAFAKASNKPTPTGEDPNAILDNLRATEANDAELSLNLNELFASINFDEYAFYTGSMTEPGCEEGIQWIIADKQVQSMNQAQFDKISALFPNGNSRAIQTNEVAVFRS